MSYRSSSHPPRRDASHYPEGWAYEYPAHHAHAAAPAKHAQHRAPATAQTPRRGRNPADYTLLHAGRQVRLGPVAFWIAVGALVIMAGWTLLTGTYFAFHDDVLKRLIARQAEMQYGYEDRIAELRAQLDRVTSRQLLDQEQFEQKLEQIARKQATLESRASALSNLPDMTPTGSIRHPARGTADPTRAAPLKPSPINDTVIFRAPPDREARLESRQTPVMNARTAAKTRGGMDGMLARMQEALDRVEQKQVAALNALEDSYDSRTRRIRGVLADLGINLGKMPAAASGTGGPFVPANAPKEAFERQLYRINIARGHVDRLNRTLTAVPVRKPVDGEIDFSSGFGMRADPFLKSPAMHTGLDMRGDTGDPVRATATGTVSHAGPNGGYGKMVEIDHGNGLTTRYAHLSAIDVKAGQSVRIGQIVGRIGSTGRSTGPHLHYETRVDGDPVDPQKYLRAGIRLGAY
ncbi:MAG: M23 family metallopeptidase [Pseudorhodoplanes sp.]|jgi:murein DD-endopeptidase MepM/ murein hydrolase activator NlpD|nr:M23 family metallopeptidase [Pseudorhodoplanes sp.]